MSSLTPLLDHEAPLPPPVSQRSGSLTVITISIGLAVVIAAVLAVSNPPLVRSLSWGILTDVEEMIDRHGVAVMFLIAAGSAGVSVFSIVMIHEGGHVVGGLLMGFRFHAMAIGPITFDRRFRLSLHFGTQAWTGGWAAMIPGRRDHLRGRTLVLVAAGPVASLAAGCAVSLLPGSKGLASAMFILGSLFGGVIELFPLRRGGLGFDGWRIWRLLRDPKWADRSLALMRLSADIQDGVMPEDLSAGDLRAAIAIRDESSETVIAHAAAYFSAFHQHKDAEAGEVLETCLRYSGHAPAMRDALMSDAAVFQARRRNRPDLAERWLAAIPAAPGRLWLRIRAEAAILEARGDAAAASTKLDEYERALRSLPVPSEAQRAMLLRLVQRWKSDLGALLHPAVVTP